jgi:hypothetical protein
VDGRDWLTLTQVARLLGVSLARVRDTIPTVRVVAGRRWYSPEGLRTLRARLDLGGDTLSTAAYYRAVAYDQGVVTS